MVMNKKYNKKSFLNDARIIKAKKLINETVKEYQNKFIDRIIKPQKSMEKDLKLAKRLRGGNLYFPYSCR